MPRLWATRNTKVRSEDSPRNRGSARQIASRISCERSSRSALSGAYAAASRANAPPCSRTIRSNRCESSSATGSKLPRFRRRSECAAGSGAPAAARGPRRSPRSELADLLVEKCQRLLESGPPDRRSRRLEILQDTPAGELEVLELATGRTLLGRERILPNRAARARAGVVDLRFDGLTFPSARHRRPRASAPPLYPTARRESQGPAPAPAPR